MYLYLYVGAYICVHACVFVCVIYEYYCIIDDSRRNNETISDV